MTRAVEDSPILPAFDPDWCHLPEEASRSLELALTHLGTRFLSIDSCPTVSCTSNTCNQLKNAQASLILDHNFLIQVNAIRLRLPLLAGFSSDYALCGFTRSKKAKEHGQFCTAHVHQTVHRRSTVTSKMCRKGIQKNKSKRPLSRGVAREERKKLYMTFYMLD